MPKIIFFDFDGTLIRSSNIKTESFIELFKNEKEIDNIADYLRKNAGVSRYEKFEHIYKNMLHRSLGNEAKEQLSKKFSDLVLERILNCPLVTGTKEFLKKHHSKTKIYVISATPAEELEYIIKKRELADYFKGIYGAPLKKSETMLKVAKQEGIVLSDVLFVGDSMADYNEAIKAGIRFIGLENAKGTFPNGTQTVNDLNELDKVI